MNTPLTPRTDVVTVTRGTLVMFQPRIYSQYYRRMIPIAGNAALQTTHGAALTYARHWLWSTL